MNGNNDQISSDPIIPRIECALDQIRQSLSAHGGGIEFVNYHTDTGLLSVRFIGVCCSCPYAQQTLQTLVLDSVQNEVPEVTKIELAGNSTSI